MNNTKEFILKTSLLLFLQKSYKDVTMKEIVEKTGLSKGAFYHYFKSKDDLFKEIVGLFFSLGAVDYTSFDNNSLKNFYFQYVEHTAGAIENINMMFGIEQTEKTVTTNFFLLLFEAVSRFPEFLKLEKEMYAKDIKIWEKVIINAQQTGEIKTESNIRQIAELFLYLTDGVFIRYVNSDKSAGYKDSLKKAFDTLYDSLKSVGRDNLDG